MARKGEVRGAQRRKRKMKRGKARHGGAREAMIGKGGRAKGEGEGEVAKKDESVK